ncbi:Berberine bridge enzyme-like 15 [Linum grandiflorum]
MKYLQSAAILLLFSFAWNDIVLASSSSVHENFIHCLSTSSAANVSKITFYTPSDPSYSAVLQFSIQNLRFINTSSASKPLVIVTPLTTSHVQSALLCSKKHNLHLRIRGGGHDYEGLSYLINMSRVTVDVASRTAWVQGGATIGELYYQIGTRGNNTLAFPAGEVLRSRVPLEPIRNFKAKSDYVVKPIPEHAVEGVWRLIMRPGIEDPEIILSPYGGRMSEISDSSIPFPHRAGNKFKIQHLIYWVKEGEEAKNRHIGWIRELYGYLAPHVSKNPRAAYVNYRDLDVGMNNREEGDKDEQEDWGVKYFKGNYKRLVHVKTVVDPTNFFRNEQSISPIYDD